MWKKEKGQDAVVEVISRREASLLLQKKDYYADVELLDIIQEAAHRARTEFLIWMEKTECIPQHVAADKEPDVLDLMVLLLQNRTKTYRIQRDLQGSTNVQSAYLRVKANTVFHLGKALRTALVESLGLLVAYVGASTLHELLLVWIGVKLADLSGRLMSCYEELHGSKEKSVFEAVYKLQNQYSVKNYDQLKRGNLDGAFGKISPTIESIHDELFGKVDRKEIEDILRELRRRNVLRERNGSWSVAFW